MKLKVKILQGPECNVDVTSEDSIEKLKDLVEAQLSISPSSQKLLLRGKALSEGTRLGEYNIKEGDKLHLVVKKDQTPPEATPSTSTSTSTGCIETQTEQLPRELLAGEVFRVLKAHCSSDSEARKVSALFCQKLEKRLLQLSLDDIERVCHGWEKEGKFSF